MRTTPTNIHNIYIYIYMDLYICMCVYDTTTQNDTIIMIVVILSFIHSDHTLETVRAIYIGLHPTVNK